MRTIGGRSDIVWVFVLLGAVVVAGTGCPKRVGPTADFTASATTGFAPATIQFTDTSDPGTSPITSWSWDFDNDGTPDSTNQNPVYTFTQAGLYSVSLTVITDVGSHTMAALGYVDIDPGVGPTASFKVSHTTGVAPLEVQFTDYSLAGTSPIVAWDWDFDGDGNPDSGDPNPAHVFNTPGLHSVTLTVTTDVGSDSHTEINYITVVEEPGAIWQQRTAHAAWNARYGHSIIVHEEAGQMWLMGGFDNASLYGDVWHSSDGATWIQFATAGSMWTARYYHTSVFFKGKAWVMGGYDGSTSGATDVWSSSNGVNWTPEQANAPWAPRFAHASVVFKDKMWVLGGSTTTPMNDVWSSPDGINWTPETLGAGWSARMVHASVVLNDKIWVLGGRDIAGPYDDVWSSPDGINWTPVLTGAPWGPRESLAVTVLNNEIWLMGGADSQTTPMPTYYRDVWSSPDGINWTPSPVVPGWLGRAVFPGLAFDFRLWAIGGTDTNPPSPIFDDVWCSSGY